MKINESNYIRFLLQKNEEALTYVMEEYGGLIKAVVKKHLGAAGTAQDMEECLNDVFMGIWNNACRFDPERSSFKNWAAGIARYKALDYLKKISAYQYRNQVIKTGFAYEDSGPENAAENYLSEEMEGLLQCLKPRDRELFQKIYMEEKPMDLVSQETGIKKETIYSRLSRSRKKLRAIAVTQERGK